MDGLYWIGRSPKFFEGVGDKDSGGSSQPEKYPISRILVVLFERFGWTKDYILTLTLPEIILYLRAVKLNNTFEDPEEHKNNGMGLMQAGPVDKFKTISETLNDADFERLKSGK